MTSQLWCKFCSLIALLCCVAANAQDLHIKKNISTGGYVVSSSETAIKGARERTVMQTPAGTTVTLHQCDLRRTLTLNEQAQTYLVSDDPQDDNAAKAAALATGTAAPEAQGGKIVLTTTITDTGERKTMFGYPVRHLKAKVIEEPSADACTQVRQQFEIDGWFADISKEQSMCSSLAPPVQQGAGCADRVIAKRLGSGKAGYPIQENISIPAPDGTTQTVTIQVAELSKQELPAEMFDVPQGYRRVNSLAELNGMAPQTGAPGQYAQGAPPAMQQTSPVAAQATANANALKSSILQATFNPMGAKAANQQALAVAQQQMAMGQAAMNGMGGMGGMQQMGGGVNQPAAAQVAALQALGPKAPGKIRIGVAPPDAQVGQGSNAGGDYSTPIRNAEIALMNGPAVEIAALDSHIPMQLQAEAQQKQCDYILFSSVAVKHQSGGFGKFAKFGGMAASITPIGMAGGLKGAVASQAAGMAASQMAQQQAMNQLAGFNGQIKSKDDVTVQYQLVPTGQTSPALQDSLKGKAKSDGEDVLTPLLTQEATAVLTQVTKK